MKAINIYLNFPGTTEDAFNFYKSVFGGDFDGEIMRFKNTPDGVNLSEEEQEKVMHISYTIKNAITIMGTDAMESMGQTLTMGNNFYILVDVDNKKEADEFFNKLSEGGKVELAMQDMFWGAYYGMFSDKFGIQWMINFTTK